jgi:hypothetical protein
LVIPGRRAITLLGFGIDEILLEIRYDIAGANLLRARGGVS